MDILGKLEAVEARYEELNRLLAEPQVLSNSSLFQKYSKEQASLTEIVSGYRRLKTIMRQIDESQEIQDDRSADPELREMAASEVDRLRNERADTEREIKLLLLPKDPNDERNVIFEVRAGTGGEEAALFAAELFRMYVRYAEGRRWKVEVLNTSETGIGGLKEVIASIEGRGAYSRLKYESGVHRVQRVPVTESGGRIHTSAVTVAMLPEAEDVEVQIDQKDLRIDTFCSSGPGGQSVNTTYSAVRITHLPSGLVVSCQDEKSQIKNKARAMKVLMARLLDKKRSEAEAERAKTRKEQVGTGDRSERIRTYNFPQNRVTDHRVGVTLHRLDAVMGGDLDEIIDALATAETAERLKSIEVEAGVS
jgi:peptide chain release factor 1